MAGRYLVDPPSNKFKLDSPFNWPSKFIAVLFLLVGVAFLKINYIVSIILIIISALVLTAFNGLEINNIDKKYIRYTWLLSWKYGEFKKFDSIENIFINSGTSSQTYYSMSNKALNMGKNIFNGWVKFSNGKTVFLFDHKNKSALEERLKPIAKKLQTTIVDHTADS